MLKQMEQLMQKLQLLQHLLLNQALKQYRPKLLKKQINKLLKRQQKHKLQQTKQLLLLPPRNNQILLDLQPLTPKIIKKNKPLPLINLPKLTKLLNKMLNKKN